MNATQRMLVRESFDTIVPVAHDFAQSFYRRLFELDPQLRPLFKTGLDEQARKLMQALTIVVRSLDHFEEMFPAIQALGERHIAYGIAPSMYDTVGMALVGTIETYLGPDRSPDVLAAWVDLYTQIVVIMRAATPRHAVSAERHKDLVVR